MSLYAALFCLLLISPGRILELSFTADLVCYACRLLLFYRYADSTMPPRAALAASAVVSLCPLMWVCPATGLETSSVVLILLSMPHLFQTLANSSYAWMQPFIVTGLILCQLAPFAFDGRFGYRAHKYDQWIELGQFLAKQQPPGTLAIGAAGKVPFFSGWKTIDMIGLNNAHIGQAPAKADKSFAVGHNKFDADYVLSLSPDLIATWGNKEGDLWWGLSKGKYLTHGYRLKYVVHATAESKQHNIIDVSSLSEVEINRLYADCYRYYVLAKAK